MLEQDSNDRPDERDDERLRVLVNAYMEIAHLETALVSARRIGAAVGIVMARRRMPYEDAFAQLVQVSQQRHVKVKDLAEEVLYIGDLPVSRQP